MNKVENIKNKIIEKIINKLKYRTGRLSLTASTGLKKGHANLCFQRVLITVFLRNCSWFVMRPLRLLGDLCVPCICVVVLLGVHFM